MFFLLVSYSSVFIFLSSCPYIMGLFSGLMLFFFSPFKLRLSFFFIGDCHLFQFKSDMAHFNDNSFFNIILIAT